MAEAAVAAKLTQPGGGWIAVPVLVVVAIFLYPLSFIVREALTGGGTVVSFAKVGAILAAPTFGRAIGNTLRIALSATAGCLITGLILAIIFAFVPFPGRAAVARLIDTFIALPTFLVALAFTFIYGSAGILNQAAMALTHVALPPIDFLYSSWGVILAEVTVYTPFALRPLLAAFGSLDPVQLQVAASLGARPVQVIREVILPAALPALLAGGSLCLLLTVNEFGIVLFIGAKGVITLPLLVYDKAIQQFDYAGACVLALVNICLSLALYLLYRAALGRFGGSRAGLV